MGSLFQQGGMTNPGTALMSSASSGEPIFIGTPSQVQQHLGQARDADIKSGINNPVMNPKPQAPFPTQGQPTFQQAASAGANPGGVNALSPGLNKAGKLMTLLTSGLQGALAGRAASENAVIASGGRRSGGAGMGFEAAQAYPWQQIGRELGAQQQAAQTGVLQSEAQNVNIPGMGAIPGWLAKAMGPAYLRQQGTLGAAQTSAGARVQAAEIGQKFKAVPGVGLFDTTTRQVVPGTANGVTITPEIAQDYQLPQEFIGKPMNVGQLASLEGAQSRNLTTVQGAQGPALVNKTKGTAQSLNLGSPAVAAAQARPVQVANPNNPGEVTYTTAGNAIKTGAPSPQGAATAAAKTEAKSEVPTNIGNLKVGFNTAIQHADLLKSAILALGNGNQQTLNSLKNRFKTEFGVTGPITAEAISDAYTREVTSVLSKGHMTDSEISSVGKTLNVNRQSPQQSLAVIDAYRALAQSKMNVLQQQANAAKGGGNKEIHYKIVNGQLVPQ